MLAARLARSGESTRRSLALAIAAHPSARRSASAVSSLLLRETVAVDVLMSRVQAELVTFDMVDAVRRG